MTFAQLLAGAAVVLALEGLIYALAPGAMRRAVTALAALPEDRLRQGGLLAAVAGTATAWLLAGG